LGDIATRAWYDDPGRPATIGVGDAPEDVATDGTNIYVTNLIDGTVSVIDPTTDTVSVVNPNTNTVTATIPVGTEPWGVAFDGTNIYVSNAADDTVSKLLPE